MKALLVLATITAACVMIRAEQQEPLKLWPNGAPGALGQEEKDVPTLTPYLVDEGGGTGAAVIICPGGGYGGLASHEGHDYALWLNQNGVAGFVLKYRLGSGGYRHPRMLQDAARAIRLVRSRAGEWKVDAKKVGIMGSSAGGHLASTALTHFERGDAESPDAVERESSRPDLGILCYPVITMGPYTHQGSKRNLLGERPPADLVWQLSNELQVTPETPPTFLWHTSDDAAVDVMNSLSFGVALRTAGVPFDLHVYQTGRHGLGLADKPPFNAPHPWAADCLYFLRQHGFVRAPEAK